MKVVVALCVFGAVMCQRSSNANNGNFAHQSVFDYMKVLTNPEIYALLASREAQWPVHTGPIEPPSFDCAQKQYPGFYADPNTQCQTFHRCDINGNLTSYVCVNMTVFNPITLICDYWFNVDCAGFIKDENFGNRRLYQEALPLFDSPAGNRKSGKGGAGPDGNWIWIEPGASTPRPGAATIRRGGAPASGNAGGSVTAAATEEAAANSEVPDENSTASA